MAMFAEVTENEYITICDIVYCESQFVIGLFILQ